MDHNLVMAEGFSSEVVVVCNLQFFNDSYCFKIFVQFSDAYYS